MNKSVPYPKIFSVLFLLVLPFFITACSVSDLPLVGPLLGGGSGSGKILVWGLWEPKEVYAPVIEDFKSVNSKITIEYEERPFVSLKSYKESVFTRINDGSASDILLVHNSWVPSLVGKLSPAPSKIFTADEFAGTFYPVAKDYGVSDGKVYGVPVSYDGLALIYNRDMFSAAGISTPPTTWTEFRDFAMRLTKKDEKGNILQAGAAVGAVNNVEHFSDILGMLFAQGDIKVPSELNTQQAADALSFYTNFVTSEKVWSDVLQPSTEAFADKKVAMIFAPSWQVLNIIARNPKVNIGVAPTPRALDLDGKPIEKDWASFWMFVVPKNSKNTKASWEFLKFLTKDESQRKLFAEESKLRVFGEPFSKASLAGELSGNAYLAPYVKMGVSAKSGILAGRSGNDKETDVLKTAVNSVLSGVTPAEALATAHKELNK